MANEYVYRYGAEYEPIWSGALLGLEEHRRREGDRRPLAVATTALRREVGGHAFKSRQGTGEPSNGRTGARQMSMSRTTSYEPGNVLSAADALIGGQEMFTREQVAQLIAMAYDSGRTSTWLDDMAETVSVWEDHAVRRASYEEKVAARIAEMEHRAEMARLRGGLPPKKPYHGGPVEWESGAPQHDVLTPHTRRTLAAAAEIPAVGNQAEPGTAGYIAGWVEMKRALAPSEWANVVPSLTDATLLAIRTAEAKTPGARAPATGKRHLNVVRCAGGTT